MDVLVGVEDRGRIEGDLGEPALDLDELLGREEPRAVQARGVLRRRLDRKSTRLNSSH